MAGFGSSTGFTLLVWVDPESYRLQNLAEEQRIAKKKEMLEDTVTLLCGRWGMEGTCLEDRGDLYAFFSCSKFVVSSATIIRALGDLSSCVKFHRGGPADKAEFLIRYRQCLQKYNVQDKVSDAFSGGEYEGNSVGTNWNANKRPRTK
ncbi:nonstructural protein 3 [Chaphamaparvovirus galliform4]|uniref:Nonstructural protein 3 n=1 Tax=Chaphamaparvovirus galliform4 TaxID=3052109 RepID=A0ABY4D5S4_9VIRU|nr:nonstructural protein 3 [Chaphamaparvovirus galliform4]